MISSFHISQEMQKQRNSHDCVEAHMVLTIGILLVETIDTLYCSRPCEVRNVITLIYFAPSLNIQSSSISELWSRLHAHILFSYEAVIMKKADPSTWILSTNYSWGPIHYSTHWANWHLNSDYITMFFFANKKETNSVADVHSHYNMCFCSS